MKIRRLLLTVALPIGIALLTFIITFWVKDVDFIDSFILTLLMGMTTSLFTLSFTAEQLSELYDDLNQNLQDVESFLEIKAKSEQIDHPYFRKWSRGRLKSILEQNREFFSGTNHTDPHAVDTFGIEGLSYTKKHGIIKAVSVVPDYWEDAFAREYLEKQRQLITKEGVTIQRIFVFSKERESTIGLQMKEQADMGIKVRFIYSDNEYIPSEWLEEDYLIQDDTLLVQIFCKSHRFDVKNEKNNELITLNKRLVDEKIERFNRLWERAKPFSEL